MAIDDINRLMTEFKIAAAQAKGINQAAETEERNGPDFSKVFSEAINKVSELQSETSRLQKAFELNDPNVELPDVMVAMQKSRVAFTAMTEVRNKLVKAYQDIMSMPV